MKISPLNIADQIFASIMNLSFSLILCPIFIATSMALGDGIVHWLSAISCGIFAITIHIGTYLIYNHTKTSTENDTTLFEKTTSTFYQYIPFIIAFLISFYFLSKAGWGVWIASIIIILFSVLINNKFHPLREPGSKELMIFLSYGPLALAGTYYIQTAEMNTAIFLAGCASGLIAVTYYLIDSIFHMSVLHKTAQEHLLIVRLGKTRTFYLLLFSLFAGLLMPIIIFNITQDHNVTLFAALTIFLSIPLITHSLRKPDENFKVTNSILLISIYWIYSLIFSIGWFF